MGKVAPDARMRRVVAHKDQALGAVWRTGWDEFLGLLELLAAVISAVDVFPCLLVDKRHGPWTDADDGAVFCMQLCHLEGKVAVQSVPSLRQSRGAPYLWAWIFCQGVEGDAVEPCEKLIDNE